MNDPLPNPAPAAPPIIRKQTFWGKGEPMVWVTGAALAIMLLMALGLIGVVLVNGLGYFWTRPLERIELADGTARLGELTGRSIDPNTGIHRVQLKIGNRDLYGADFAWVGEEEITGRDLPADAVVIERMEYGNFHGFIDELQVDGLDLPREVDLWDRFTAAREAIIPLEERIEANDRVLSRFSERMSGLERSIRKLRLDAQADTSPAIAKRQAEIAALREEFDRLNHINGELRGQLSAFSVVLHDIGGRSKTVALHNVVRAYRPNAMSTLGKAGLYLERLWELLTGQPREANTEGGLFPAIFGTVMMVFMMSWFCIPLGVIAAIYLREYAKEGLVVRMVRIAVNNLAGVPSIVYGIFGLGFFVYGFGSWIDRTFFPEMLPTPTFGTGGILWSSLTLALLTVPVVIVSTEEALAAIPRGMREGSLALGSTKFQTLMRILLPMASPGIMTGMILSMARAAGEVAPLMIVGVVKLAPTLPLDGNFPFLHLDRKFMHLGFHIYDVGFQSPNVEAAKPMVYVTTMLLVAIVVAMSALAIWLRNRMRKKFTSGVF
jgi:phosphate transport system permease protein